MKQTTRLTLITILLFMSRGMIGPISSVLWRDLGASYLTIGVLSTVTSLTAILASPLWGRALDRTQQRQGFLISGLVILAISTGLIAVVPRYEWLFLLNILMTVGQVAYSTSSLTLMGDWLEVDTDRDRQTGKRSLTSGRRMGTYRGWASLGFGVMAFAAGTVVDWMSLRAPFGFSAFFLLAGAVLALGVREAPDVQEKGDGTAGHQTPDSHITGEPVDIRQALPTLPLVPLLVAALLWALVTGAVYAVWANYMVEEIGLTPAQMTRLWSLASLSEFPLMMVAGWLSDRVGRLPMLAVGFAAWTIVFTGYLVVPAMPWIMVVQLIRGFAYSAHTATSMIYAAEVRQRSERGRVSGYYSSAGSVGSILGSSMGGAVTEFAGFRTLIGLCAGIIGAGAVYLGGAAVKKQSKVKSEKVNTV